MKSSKYKTIKIPESLKLLQQQFINSITAPFLFDENTNDFEIQTKKYEPHIISLMEPINKLTGSERLSTYNRQYWYRLLTIMQEEFPLMCELMGLWEFNKMVSAYLDVYPSTSKTLRDLSNNLETFLDQDHTWNLDVLKECARLERIYILSFDSCHLPILNISSLDINQQQKVIENPLTFQDHWFLFEENWNFVELKKQGNKGSLREQQNKWAIYRGSSGISCEHLSPLQFTLLQLLSQNLSLEIACEQLSLKLDDNQLEFVMDNIQKWFQYWLNLGWFC